MKRKIYQLLLAALSALIVTGCYDDDKVWDALDGQQQRLDALEKWQATANANIEALQILLSAQDYVTDVTPVILDGETVGYTIAFHIHAPITLYHGAAGPAGPTGADGPQGETGADGTTPVVSVTQADDGNWYWTLNGELLTDAHGLPIRANGHNGTNGPDGQPGTPGTPGTPGADNNTPGADGTPAPAPQLSTGAALAQNPDAQPVDGTSAQWNPEAIYLSVDGGITWAQVSGKPGIDTDPWFTSVNYDPDTNPDYIVFNLADNTSFRAPRYVEFGLQFFIYLPNYDPKEIDPNEPILLAKDKQKLYFTPRGSGINARDVHVTARIVGGVVNGPSIEILTDKKNKTEYAIGFNFGNSSQANATYILLVTATDNAGHSCTYDLEVGLLPNY